MDVGWVRLFSLKDHLEQRCQFSTTYEMAHVELVVPVRLIPLLE